MPQIEALYYPNYEPPMDWLRTYLLFFDRIITIVPKREKQPFSPKMQEFTDALPGSVTTISPKRRDVVVKGINLKRLDAAFSLINKTSHIPKKRFIENFMRKSKGEELNGISLIHDDKLRPEIFRLLQKHNLIFEDFGKYLQFMKEGGITFIPNLDQYNLIHKKAGNLILSHIANNLSLQYGFRTLTDQDLDFTFNKLNSLGYQPKGDPNTKLIRSIVRGIIPKEINELKLEEYKQIRSKFSGIKKSFFKTINDLNALYNLEQIENQTVLNNKIKEITEDYIEDLKKFKKSESGRRFRKWIPTIIGSFATVLSPIFASDQRITVGLGSITVISRLIPEISPKILSPEENVQHLLAQLESRILEPVEIRRLYLSDQ